MVGRWRLSLDRPKGDVEPKLRVVWAETGNDAVLRLSLISMGSHMARGVCVCPRAPAHASVLLAAILCMLVLLTDYKSPGDLSTVGVNKENA